MRLYVDDLRICPDGWTLACTNTEAIRLLASGFIDEEISIDHDIVGTQETFQPVAYYLTVMNSQFRLKKITFHTANVEAAYKMILLLKDAGIEAIYGIDYGV